LLWITFLIVETVNNRCFSNHKLVIIMSRHSLLVQKCNNVILSML
jgi:hypothetical protein